MRRHAETLKKLTDALAQFLHQYFTETMLTHDTSLFLEETVAQCLYGCTCGACGAIESCSASDEEWMDFDFSAYAGNARSLYRAESYCRVQR
jgi:hypothetical protein